MTFQPPPPPPPPPPPAGPPTPPPPPPGQWGPPPGQGPAGGGSFDPKSIDRMDWGILGAGVLLFLFSFIDFYSGATVTVNGHSESFSGGSASAWHSVFGGGFFAWFAMVFGVAGAAILALQIFMPHIKFAIASRALTFLLFAIGFVFEFIAIFVTPGYSYSGFGTSASASIDHGFGFWLSLILLAAGAGLSLMRAQQTNTTLPGPLNNLPKIGK